MRGTHRKKKDEEDDAPEEKQAADDDDKPDAVGKVIASHFFWSFWEHL